MATFVNGYEYWPFIRLIFLVQNSRSSLSTLPIIIGGNWCNCNLVPVSIKILSPFGDRPQLKTLPRPVSFLSHPRREKCIPNVDKLVSPSFLSEREIEGEAELTTWTVLQEQEGVNNASANITLHGGHSAD